MFKKIQRYSFSLLAILTAFCVLTQFTVLAKTGTVVKNTGVRHTICNSLSSQAKAYYSTNGASYSAVSKLKGGNDNCLTTVDSALFDELHDLMEETMTNPVSYDSLTSHWVKTDANNGSSNACLFYSDSISSNYNREHVWPKSRASFKKQNGGCDPHHLRPTNEGMNSTRSSYCMGNVRGVLSGFKTKTNGNGSVYYLASADRVEVDDKVKGDVARIFLYVYCRWEEPNLFMNTPKPVIGPGDDANNGKKVIESLDTLLKWCEIDPVDTWEMSRNDQCENLVGNRNVFIDYPEYAWLLFGKSVPKTMTTPSGEAKKGDSGNNQGGNTSSNTSTNTSSNTSSSNTSSNISKPNTSTTTSTNTSSGNSKPTTSTNTSSNTSANTSTNNSSNTIIKPNTNSSINSGTSSNVSTENSTHQNTNTSQNQTTENTTTDSSESNVGGINSKPQNSGKPFDPSLLSGSSTGSEYDDSMTGIDDILERINSLNLWVKIAIVVFVVGTAVAAVIVVRNIKIKRKDD